MSAISFFQLFSFSYSNTLKLTCYFKYTINSYFSAFLTLDPRALFLTLLPNKLSQNNGISLILKLFARAFHTFYNFLVFTIAKVDIWLWKFQTRFFYLTVSNWLCLLHSLVLKGLHDNLYSYTILSFIFVLHNHIAFRQGDVLPFQKHLGISLRGRILLSVRLSIPMYSLNNQNRRF